MRPLKTQGRAELETLRNRAGRQFGMGRITEPDYLYIRERLDEIDARIVEMEEINEDGRSI